MTDRETLEVQCQTLCYRLYAILVPWRPQGDYVQESAGPKKVLLTGVVNQVGNWQGRGYLWNSRMVEI